MLKSIKTQIWLLFAVIFIFNAVSVGILLTGWTQNRSLSEDLEHKIGHSQEISGITSAHVNWVNALRDHLDKGVQFTGSLDPSSCSFGEWLGMLDESLKNDESIAGAITNIIPPHDLIHNEAGKIVELSKTDKARAYSQFEKVILPNVLTIVSELNVIANRCNELAVVGSAASCSTLQTNSLMQLIITGIVFLVSVAIALIVVRLTVKPTIAVTNAAELLSQGHLDTQININSQNELGRMASSLNKAISLISAYIGDFRETGSDVRRRYARKSRHGLYRRL